MLHIRTIVVVALVAFIAGCASGTIDLAGDKKSEALATIIAADRFYLLWGHHCGVLEADGVSMDSISGAKKVKVSEGLHDLRVRCVFIINYVGSHVYFGDLTFLAQAGHEYTVLFQNTRKCIVVIDDENDAEVDANCNLGGYSSPF